MPRPIVFFGSSLNPPTKAHLALVQHMIEAAKNQDPKPVIVLAPVYKHIFSKPDLADFEPRVKLTQVQFEDEIKNGDVIVSNIEEVVYEHMRAEEAAKQGVDPATVKFSCGSVDVLDYIKKHPELFPDCDVNHISLMLGGDTYNDFVGGKWKDAEKIIGLCDVIHVFDRDGVKPTAPKAVVTAARNGADAARLAKLDKIEVAAVDQKFAFHEGVIKDPEIQQISSTKVRNDINHAIKGVTDTVLGAIRTHFPEIYKSTLEETKKLNAAAVSKLIVEGFDKIRLKKPVQDKSNESGAPVKKNDKI